MNSYELEKYLLEHGVSEADKLVDQAFKGYGWVDVSTFQDVAQIAWKDIADDNESCDGEWYFFSKIQREAQAVQVKEAEPWGFYFNKFNEDKLPGFTGLSGNISYDGGYAYEDEDGELFSGESMLHYQWDKEEENELKMIDRLVKPYWKKDPKRDQYLDKYPYTDEYGEWYDKYSKYGLEYIKDFRRWYRGWSYDIGKFETIESKNGIKYVQLETTSLAFIPKHARAVLEIYRHNNVYAFPIFNILWVIRVMLCFRYV